MGSFPFLLSSESDYWVSEFFSFGAFLIDLEMGFSSPTICIPITFQEDTGHGQTAWVGSVGGPTGRKRKGLASKGDYSHRLVTASTSVIGLRMPCMHELHSAREGHTS